LNLQEADCKLDCWWVQVVTRCKHWRLRYTERTVQAS